MKIIHISIMVIALIAMLTITTCDFFERTNPDDPMSSNYIKPPEGTFIIGNGIATNQTNIILTMNVPGVEEMRFGNTVNERNSADWESYATTKKWEIEGDDEGQKTVYGEFRNSLDDVIQPAALIAYDITPPAGGTICINNSDIATSSLNVLLTISATDNIAMGTMCFSNDKVNWSEWEAYSESKSWTLTDSEGIKIVYARFRDVAGNDTTSDISDSIIYDDVIEPEIAIQKDHMNIPHETGIYDFQVTAKNYPQDSIFTIYNLGSANLTIDAINITGDISFNLLSQPADTIILPQSYTTFTVRFNPSSTGIKNAQISINNNDYDENPYTFAIYGSCDIGVGLYGWTRRIGGVNGDYGDAIITDSNNNIYLCGYFHSTVNFRADFDGGTDNKTAPGRNPDIFLTKINSDGTYGWTHSIGDINHDQSNSISTDSSDNIYITGVFYDTVNFRADFDGGTDIKTSAGYDDIFVTKTNSDGSYAWTRRIGGPDVDTTKSISTDSSDNIYITGVFYDTVDFRADFDGGADIKTSAGSGDIFVTKINSDGTYGWTRHISGVNEEVGNSITIDGINNIYLCGYFHSTVNFRADFDGGTDNKTASGRNPDIFLTKINNDGTYGWTYRMGGVGVDRSYSVTTDSSDNIYITGYFNDTVDFRADFDGGTDVKTSEGSGDIFVTKINTDGSYGWTRRIGGSDLDTTFSINTDSSDNIYINGIFRNIVNFSADFGNTDYKTSAGDADIFITKINSDGTYGWTYCMGATSTDYGNALTTDTDGCIYTTGYFNDTVNFRTDFDGDTENKTSAGYGDIYIMKIY